MPKFRKRPIVIEAEQWFPGKDVVGVRCVMPYDDQTCGLIDTLEGKMIVDPGDWIITDVHGERYPCKPDIFAKMYDQVE